MTRYTRECIAAVSVIAIVFLLLFALPIWVGP